MRAIASLSYAWVLCTPSDVANVSSFCNALNAFTVQQRAFGATWEALSSFHAELLRKVDEESEKYALNESSISRASPRAAWIDMPSRYLQALQQSVAHAAAKTAAVDAVKESHSKLEAALKKATAASTAETTKKARESQKKAERNTSDLRKKLDALKKKPATPGADASAAKAAAQESNEQKRKRGKVEMLEAHGLDDQGREPCYFHHREGPEKCKFQANNCKAGHHNGKAKDA